MIQLTSLGKYLLIVRNTLCNEAQNNSQYKSNQPILYFKLIKSKINFNGQSNFLLLNNS